MKIYTITARDKEFDEPTMAHRTTSFSKSHLALVRLNCGRFDHDFDQTVDNLEDCPECGLPLSEHGLTTEIDTLEDCIEIDNTGDY